MGKGSYISLLITLFLVPVSVIGCQTQQKNSTKNDVTPSNQIPAQSKNSEDLNQNFIEINNAYSEYKKSIDQLIIKLEEAVRNQQLRQLLNSNNAKQKLDLLKKEIEDLKQLLPASDEQAGKIIEQINADIKDISMKVIEPLAKGLAEKDAVSQVQKNLNVLVKRNINSQNYGNFGDSTQEDIDSFLTTKSNDLKDKISQLETVIKTSALATKADNKNESINNEQNQLKEQIQELENETKKQRLQQELPLLTIISVAFGGGIVGALSILGLGLLPDIYKKFRESEADRKLRRTSSRKAKQNEENSSFHGDQQLPGVSHNQTDDAVKELYGKVNNLEQKLSPLFSLETRLKTLEQDSRANYQSHSSSSSVAPLPQTGTRGWTQGTQISTTESSSKPSNQYPSSQIPQFVDAYNRNPRSLAKDATEVSETEESFNNRRLGGSQPAILETSGRGNYWIITEGSFDYLIPKGNFKINKFNYTTVEFLFKCDGYKAGYSTDFQLIKPASVSPISRGEKWQLKEVGVLEFS